MQFTNAKCKAMLKQILTKKGILLVFMLLGSISSAMASEVITLMVKEDRASCTGVAPMSCLQVKYKNSKNWELFYSGIQGFKYQEGYRYTLSVIRTKRKNVPADASAYSYKLKKVLKKQKVAVKEGQHSTVTLTDKNDPLTLAAGQKWTLIHLNGDAVAGGAIHLTFDPKGNRFSGSGGCNTMFGSFTYDKNNRTITFGNVASTLMACADENANRLENEYSKALNLKTFTIETKGNLLTFYKEGGKVLEFTNNTGAGPQSGELWKYIAGNQWKLIQIEGEAQEDSPVTIAFNPQEQRFSGNSACNNYFGTYETSKNTITFGPAASTRRACTDQKLMALERTFLGLLGDQTLTFDVADQTLNFYKGNRLILMFGTYK